MDKLLGQSSYNMVWPDHNLLMDNGKGATTLHDDTRKQNSSVIHQSQTALYVGQKTPQKVDLESVGSEFNVGATIEAFQTLCRITQA